MAKYFVVVNNKEDCPEYFLADTCRLATNPSMESLKISMKMADAAPNPAMMAPGF